MVEREGGITGPPGWRLQQLGPELVWTRREEGVLFAFGIGPAGHGEPPEVRAAGLLAALDGEVESIRWGLQVHGARVVTLPVRAAGAAVRCVGECDGLLTRARGTGILVWTADCVPILLAGGEAVAAVHAGWRGVAAGIASTAVARLQRLSGVPVAQVRALLGPSVGPCHYPVGREVIEALGARGGRTGRRVSGDGVDLRARLADELKHLGLQHVGSIGGCVACTRQFASHRRDGVASGRQLSLVVRLG